MEICAYIESCKASRHCGQGFMAPVSLPDSDFSRQCSFMAHGCFMALRDPTSASERLHQGTLRLEPNTVFKAPVEMYMIFRVRPRCGSRHSVGLSYLEVWTNQLARLITKLGFQGKEPSVKHAGSRRCLPFHRKRPPPGRFGC